MRINVYKTNTIYVTYPQLYAFVNVISKPKKKKVKPPLFYKSHCARLDIYIHITATP